MNRANHELSAPSHRGRRRNPRSPAPVRKLKCTRAELALRLRDLKVEVAGSRLSVLAQASFSPRRFAAGSVERLLTVRAG
jgi:hypothetical protein